MISAHMFSTYRKLFWIDS